MYVTNKKTKCILLICKTQDQKVGGLNANRMRYFFVHSPVLLSCYLLSVDDLRQWSFHSRVKIIAGCTKSHASFYFKYIFVRFQSLKIQELKLLWLNFLEFLSFLNTKQYCTILLNQFCTPLSNECSKKRKISVSIQSDSFKKMQR